MPSPRPKSRKRLEENSPPLSECRRRTGRTTHEAAGETGSRSDAAAADAGHPQNRHAERQSHCHQSHRLHCRHSHRCLHHRHQSPHSHQQSHRCHHLHCCPHHHSRGHLHHRRCHHPHPSHPFPCCCGASH
ncbi:unnamed protein product [Closterium sp. NIES-54]